MAIGIYTNGSTVLSASLLKNGQVEWLQTFPNVKQFYILAQERGKKALISGLHAEELLFREIPLSLNKKAFFETLPFQLESLCPFALEEAVVFPYFTKENPSLLITKKTFVQSHTERFEKEGIELSLLSTPATALFHFAKFVLPDLPSSLLILHFSSRSALLLLEEKMRFFHAFNWSEHDPPELLEKELSRLQATLKSKFQLDKMEFLIGGPFPKGLKLPQAPLTVNKEHSLYALPIGWALEALSKKGPKVQFYQKELIPFKKKESEKKKLKQLASLALLSLALLFSVWKGKELSQKNSIEKEFQTLFPGKAFSLELLCLEEERPTKGRTSLSIGSLLNSINDLKLDVDIEQIKILPYTCLAEIEIATPDSKTAESARNILKKNLADPQKEFKWKKDNRTSSASFYLK